MPFAKGEGGRVGEILVSQALTANEREATDSRGQGGRVRKSCHICMCAASSVQLCTSPAGSRMGMVFPDMVARIAPQQRHVLTNMAWRQLS